VIAKAHAADLAYLHVMMVVTQSVVGLVALLVQDVFPNARAGVHIHVIPVAIAK